MTDEIPLVVAASRNISERPSVDVARFSTRRPSWPMVDRIRLRSRKWRQRAHGSGSGHGQDRARLRRPSKRAIWTAASRRHNAPRHRGPEDVLPAARERRSSAREERDRRQGASEKRRHADRSAPGGIRGLSSRRSEPCRRHQLRRLRVPWPSARAGSGAMADPRRPRRAVRRPRARR